MIYLRSDLGSRACNRSDPRNVGIPALLRYPRLFPPDFPIVNFHFPTGACPITLVANFPGRPFRLPWHSRRRGSSNCAQRCAARASKPTPLVVVHCGLARPSRLFTHLLCTTRAELLLRRSESGGGAASQEHYRESRAALDGTPPCRGRAHSPQSALDALD